MIWRLVFLLCAVIGLTAQAGAATYYVANTGANASGAICQNISTPCLTITYVYSNLVAAGDTILVKPGTYTDYSTSGTHTWPALNFYKSGTSGSPITIRSITTGGAIIDGGGANGGRLCVVVTGNYNIVDGFKMTNCEMGGVSIQQSNHSTITRNEIYNNGIWFSTKNLSGQGIFESSTYSPNGNSYTSNYIHDNGSSPNFDHGMYMSGINDVIANNIIYHNIYGYGIQIAGYSTISGWKIYNNTIAYNGLTTNAQGNYARSGIILWQSIDSVDISNNIFYGHPDYAVSDCCGGVTGGTAILVKNNVSFNNSAGDYNLSLLTGVTQSGNIHADPLFVNANSDWHLQAGSPAIGAGLNLSSTITTDYAGNPRPGTGAWDIGAYQTGALPPLAQATFVSVNTTTKGTWKGTYGADGYIVIAASKSIPAYVTTTLTETPAPYYVWWKGCHGPNSQFNNANCTADARALQIPDSTYGRIAASYYSSSSLSFPVNMTDGATHQMAIYALDWDNVGRAETIAITDTATGTPLDSRTLAANSFVNGSYVVWTIKGAVTVTVTKTAGPNAVVSGVFFN